MPHRRPLLAVLLSGLVAPALLGRRAGWRRDSPRLRVDILPLQIVNRRVPANQFLFSLLQTSLGSGSIYPLTKYSSFLLSCIRLFLPSH